MKTSPLYRLAVHIGKSWRYHFSLQLATLVVLVASFTVVGGVLTIGSNLYRVLTLWGESMQVSVYLNETASLDNISSIKKFLENDSRLEKPRLVSKEEALITFREQMASYAPDLLNDKELLRFIPASFQFSVSKLIAAADQLEVMQTTANSLKIMPGVDEVTFGQDWVKNYTAFIRTLNWGGIIFITIIITCAAFVMANAIHTSVVQRRNEIEVMELIGATPAYIRLPFIGEGALLGGLASFLAMGLSFGLFLVVKDYFQGQLAFLQLGTQIHFLDAQVAAELVVFGVLTGALSAWLCVRRINDGWAASQSSRA